MLCYSRPFAEFEFMIALIKNQSRVPVCVIALFTVEVCLATAQASSQVLNLEAQRKQSFQCTVIQNA